MATASASHAEGTKYPPIVPGASLLLAWQIRNKRVLLVGGGPVAAGRLTWVLASDALVTLVAPAPLHPEIHYRVFEDPATSPSITYHPRKFIDADLDGVDMVLTAIDDVSTSHRICKMARAKKIPVNVADVPPECDFYFGSHYRNGPLQVLVSTGGKGPKLANLIRRRIEELLPADLGEAVEKVGKLRTELRKRAPGHAGGDVSKRRMGWMVRVCDEWSLEELSTMDDKMIIALLDRGWEEGGKVPSFRDVGGKQGARWSGASGSTWRRWTDGSTISHILLGVGLGFGLATMLMRRR